MSDPKLQLKAGLQVVVVPQFKGSQFYQHVGTLEQTLAVYNDYVGFIQDLQGTVVASFTADVLVPNTNPLDPDTEKRLFFVIQIEG